MRSSFIRTVCSRCRPLSGAISSRGKYRSYAFHSNRRRLLATTVSVGLDEHQPMHPTTSSIGSHPTSLSLEQERAAVLEFERMQQTTERLLSSAAPLSPAAHQECRVAFHYWAGHRSRLYSNKANGIEYAEALLQWLLEHADPQDVESVVRSEESPNGGLVNLVESYLVPFRGTKRNLQWRETILRQQADVNVLKESLGKAARVVNSMQELHSNSSFQKLIPDYYSCSLILNIWSKRCWFLKNHTDDNLEDAFVSNSLDGVSTVTGCLQAMKDLIETMENDDAYPAPDHAAYTLLITALAQSGLPEAASESEAMLRAMEHSPNAFPSNTPYNAVLFAHAMQANEDPKHAALAASLLERMQHNQKFPDGVKPDVISFASVMLAFSNAGQPEKAQRMLELMEFESESSQLQPNIICYNTVLDAWGKSLKAEAATNAEALLNRMKTMQQSGSNPEACPDKVSYSSVILAWSRAPHANAVEHAESMLRALEDKALVEGQHHLRPDLITYNTVLDAWSKDVGRRGQRISSGYRRTRDFVPERAEALLRHMQKQKLRLEEVYVESSGTDIFTAVGPDTASYNSVLDAWSKSCSSSAISRSRNLLDEMKRDYKAGNDLVKPNRITYNIILGCIAKSREQGSVLEAEKLLKQMEDMGGEMKPDVVSYNTVMDALVKSGDMGASERAEELLETMERRYADGHENPRPNEITYNIVLNGLAKSNARGSARRAERILERMISLSKQEGREDVRPSHVSFATVLNSYSKCTEADAVDRAQELFQKIENFQHVSVNTIMFNTMINVLSRSRRVNAGQRAEFLLKRMKQLNSSGNEEVKPNTVTFSSVINCWARSGQHGAAERAEAILERMEELSCELDSHVQPNVVCYSAVLNAWARSDSPQAAERALGLLNRMERDYQKGNTNTRPNCYCYNATINTIAKSLDADKSEKARATLRRMAKAYRDGNDSVKPTLISYCTVLNACAYTTESPDQNARTFHVARSTFLEMMESESCKPNSVAYFTFLRACGKLLPPGKERDQIMAAVFRDSCTTGHTNKDIVRLMRSAVSPDIMQEFLPSGDRDIPTEWSRKVEQRSRRN